MPGFGVSEPKKKKRTLGDYHGKVYKPSDALIDMLRTPMVDRAKTKPRMSGILSEDGKKLAYSREYNT